MITAVACCVCLQVPAFDLKKRNMCGYKQSYLEGSSIEGVYVEDRVWMRTHDSHSSSNNNDKRGITETFKQEQTDPRRKRGMDV